MKIEQNGDIGKSMEFSEKLQKLRKDYHFTQEELAEYLFVSRTAISKWESGRGFPSIDSLKSISKIFEITIDELLSGNEIIKAAEEEKKETAISLRTLLYGFFDVMSLNFFFVPLFGERNGDFIQSVSLLSMQAPNLYIFIAYVTIIAITIGFGVAEIILQNYQNHFWKKNNAYISILLTVIATFVFTVSPQPYIAFFELWLLVTKGVLYIKQH